MLFFYSIFDFINKLTPRKFRWDYRDISRFPVDSKEKPEILIQSGFIAQEVQEVLKEEKNNLVKSSADFLNYF